MKKYLSISITTVGAAALVDRGFPAAHDFAELARGIVGEVYALDNLNEAGSAGGDEFVDLSRFEIGV